MKEVTYLIVDPNKRFTVKQPCPYCGGHVTAIADGFEQLDDGMWAADELSMDCSSEPDIDSIDYPTWLQCHGGVDHCEKWHKYEDAILAVLREKLRFHFK